MGGGMKTAVITGSAGQDGSYLAALLTAEGYRVIGINRDNPPVRLTDSAALSRFLAHEKPHEIYHLAAVHHAAEDRPTDDWELFTESQAVHTVATACLLEGCRRHCPAARLFFAASCHLFGTPTTPVQDETTPFRPDGIYAITKQAGVELCRYYRRRHGVFAAVGILFNHESPRRPSRFVSRKIVEAAVAIWQGRQTTLVLGDLDAEVDWGFAGDYVSAMRAILHLDQPDDFVIASGESHSVREFVQQAFGLLGLDWQRHVRVEPALLRGPARPGWRGDASKLRRATGWRPATTFAELVRLMVQAERERVGA